MSRKSGILPALVLSLAVIAGGTLSAEGPGTPPAFSVGLHNIKTNWFIVPTGPILKFGYGSLGLLPGLRSDFEGEFGAGYENFYNPRFDTDRGAYRGRDPVPADYDPAVSGKLPTVDRPNAQLDLGFRQGLIPLEDKRDELSFYVSLHTRVAYNSDSRFDAATSLFPDRNDEAMGSLVAGFEYDNVTKNEHALRKGHEAYLEGEWGPSFLSLEGTDFLRLKAEWVQYLPLFDLAGARNTLSSYLVLRGNAKYITGAQVPLFMLEKTDVRGYPIDLDSRFGASATAELRLDLPSLLGASDIFPLVFAFADAGWFSGFNDLAPGSVWAGEANALASVGGGLALDLFAFARPVISVGIPLIDDLARRLVADKNFWWKIEFDLHI